MSDASKGGILVSFVALMAFSAGLIFGLHDATSDFEADAVEAGVGEWHVPDGKRHAEFRFFAPGETRGDCGCNRKG